MFVVLVGVALAALGLGMAGFAIRSLLADVAQWRESQRSRAWEPTDGRIVRAVVTLSGFGRRRTWGARIAYSYVAAGETRTGSRVRFGTTLGQVSRASDGVHAEVARYAPGTAVTVFFAPSDPDRATLERNRPGLVGGLVLAALLMLAAAGIGTAGAYVAIGPIDDPPAFAPEDLPPLTAQIGTLLIVLGTVLGGLATRTSRRARARRPLRMIVDAAHEYRGEASTSGTVAVFGRAEAGATGPLAAPPGGEAALVYRVRVLDSGSAVVEDEGRGEFFVASDHGRVRVQAVGALLELPRSRQGDDEAARAWVDAEFMQRDTPAPETFFVEREQLTPGALVLVIGRVRRDHDGVPTLRAARGADSSLVIAAEPLAELRHRLGLATRRARVTAWTSAASFAAGVLLVLV